MKLWSFSRTTYKAAVSGTRAHLTLLQKAPPDVLLQYLYCTALVAVWLLGRPNFSSQADFAGYQVENWKLAGKLQQNFACILDAPFMWLFTACPHWCALQPLFQPSTFQVTCCSFINLSLEPFDH